MNLKTKEELVKRKRLLLQSDYWMKQFKRIGISVDMLNNLNFMLSDEETLLVPMYSSLFGYIYDFIEIKNSLDETIVVDDNNQCITGILPKTYRSRVFLVEDFIELLYAVRAGIPNPIFVPYTQNNVPDIVYKFVNISVLSNVSEQLNSVISGKNVFRYNATTLADFDLNKSDYIVDKKVKTVFIRTFPFLYDNHNFIVTKQDGNYLYFDDKKFKLNKLLFIEGYNILYDNAVVLACDFTYIKRLSLNDIFDFVYYYFYNNCYYLSELECRVLTYAILTLYTFNHYHSNSVFIIYSNKRYILQDLYFRLQKFFPVPIVQLRKTIGVYAKTYVSDIYSYIAPQIIIDFLPLSYINYNNSIYIEDKYEERSKVKLKYIYTDNNIIEYLMNFTVKFVPKDDIDESCFTNKYKYNYLDFLRILTSTLNRVKDYDEIVDFFKKTRQKLYNHTLFKTTFKEIYPQIIETPLLFHNYSLRKIKEKFLFPDINIDYF